MTNTTKFKIILIFLSFATGCAKQYSLGTIVSLASSSPLNSINWKVGALPPTTYTASATVPMASFTVEIFDQNGQLMMKNQTSQITLSVRKGTGSLQGTLTQTAQNGVVTFADIKYTKAESITLIATIDSSEISVTSPPIQVLPGPTVQLAFFTQPSTSVTLVPMTPSPLVALIDTFGNVITSGPDSSSQITLSLLGPGLLSGSSSWKNAGQAQALTLGTVSNTANQGIAVFPGLNIDTLGTRDLLVATAQTSGGILAQRSNPFNIILGPPTQLNFLQYPSQGAIAGQIWDATQQPIVAIVDVGGNTVTTGAASNSPITLTASSGTTFPAVNAVGGIATFSGLSLQIAVQNTILTATATQIYGESKPFAITAAPATQLTYTTFSQIQSAGFPFNFTITARDQFSNISTGYSGTVNVSNTTASPPAGDFIVSPYTYQFQPSDAGTYTFKITFNSAGSNRGVKVQDIANKLMVQTTSTITVTNHSATSLKIASGNSQSGPRSTVLSQPLAVVINDANGKPVQGITVNWNVTAGGGSVMRPGNSVTDGNGQATTLFTTGPFATLTGGNTITASISGYLSIPPVVFKETTLVANAFPPYQWTFTPSTASNYQCTSSSPWISQLSDCHLDIDPINSWIELSMANQQDDSSNALGLTSTSKTIAVTTGNAYWDTGLNSLRLNNGSTSDIQLGPSWTPAWESILAYWKLNDITGVAMDSSPSGIYSGTPTVGVTYIKTNPFNSNTRSAGSVTFNSSSDTISISNFPDAMASGVTLSAWINPLAVSTNGTFSVIDRFSSILDYGLYITIDSVSAASAPNTYNLTVQSKYCAAPPVFINNTGLNSWYSLAVTSTSLSTNIYINGILKQTCANSGAMTLSSVGLNTGILTLGNLASAPARFPGMLSEVAIWNKPLSSSAIHTIYQHQKSAFSGTLTSRIIDGFANGQIWTGLTWLTSQSFFKPLPNLGSTETTTLTSGLAGLWHLDEGSGSITVSDSSPTGTNVGTVGSFNNHPPTLGVSGRFNTGASFDGVDGYIDIPPNALPTSGPVTVSAWVFQNDAIQGNRNYNVTFIENSTTDRNNNITSSFFLRNSNRVYSCGFYDGINYAMLSSSAQPSDSMTWIHFVCSVDTDTLSMYQNGTLLYTRSLVSLGLDTSTPPTLSADWFLGNSPASGRALNGILNEVAIWNRTLTPTEVTQLYRRGANRLMYQVRSCSDAKCLTGATPWTGADGTSQTFFSELDQPISTPSPSLLASPNRYFQYRAILETDDNTATLSPELQSMRITPDHYDKTPAAVFNINAGTSALNYYALTQITANTGTCPGGISFNITNSDPTLSSNWYWWASTKAADCISAGSGHWCASNNTASQSNFLTDFAPSTGSNALSLVTSQIGIGNISIKAFLNTDGTHPCQLKSFGVSGTN